jgi:hypothetical protein
MASMRPFETKRIIKAEGGICEAVAGNVARADDGAGIGCLHRGRSAGSASCTTTSGLLESAARTRPPRRAETGQRRQPEEHVPDLPSMCFRIWSGRVRERSSNRFLSPASAGLESLHLLCSDKGPNHQFTRVIALQCSRKGIWVNSILRGMMNIPMVHAPEVIAAYGGSAEVMVRRPDEQCPMGRMGDAWDVAYGAVPRIGGGQVHYGYGTGRRWRSDCQLRLKPRHRRTPRERAANHCRDGDIREYEAAPRRVTSRAAEGPSLGKTPIGILYGKVR